MPRTYRVNATVRISNAIVAALLRLGVPIGKMTLLSVPGRKSGEPRTVPVVVNEWNGRLLLGSPFGNVNWVQNLRAAGGATLTRGRRAQRVAARELSPHESAAMWKELLSTAPGMIRNYFDVTPASSLDDFEREAPRHPLFELTPVAQLQPINQRTQHAA
jgi:deazaflavin-dependent oxidoreductase (nitroreductase family)